MPVEHKCNINHVSGLNTDKTYQVLSLWFHGVRTNLNDQGETESIEVGDTFSNQVCLIECSPENSFAEKLLFPVIETKRFSCMMLRYLKKPT